MNQTASTVSPRIRADGPARSAVAATARTAHAVQDWLLRRPARSVWACGIVGLVLAAAMTAALGFPPPAAHDEFSYLLAGDTFAHGRLAYPTHPMWRHFETFHVLQTPSYASKYPPAQGLAIALGQRLTGMPVVGVWISCALLVAALNWMLQSWTDRRWALWGAVAGAFWLVGRHSAGGYWAWSFWGGSVAAMGGALFFGGVRRLSRTTTISSSMAAGAGLAVLANSRPYEGLFIAVVPITVLAWISITHLRGRLWRPALITVAPMLIVAGAGLTFMGFYNFRVTGSATTPPYLVYEKSHVATPVFIGQRTPPTPEYRVALIEEFFRKGAGSSRPPQNWRQYLVMVRTNSSELLRFFVPWFVVPLLLVFPLAVRGLWMWVALASVASVASGMGRTLLLLQPHYAAPAVAAWSILLVRGARYTAQLRRGRFRAGRTIARVVFACIVASAVVEFGIGLARLQPTRGKAWNWKRQEIERSLSRTGEHLILVEYGPRHVADKEWVFNHGDIDAASVVWARSLGEAEDAELRRYFASRSAWRLRVENDNGPFILTGLTPTATGAQREPGNRP